MTGKFRGLDAEAGWINRRFANLERLMREQSAAQKLAFYLASLTSVANPVATPANVYIDPAGNLFRSNPLTPPTPPVTQTWGFTTLTTNGNGVANLAHGLPGIPTAVLLTVARGSAPYVGRWDQANSTSAAAVLHFTNSTTNANAATVAVTFAWMALA